MKSQEMRIEQAKETIREAEIEIQAAYVTIDKHQRQLTVSFPSRIDRKAFAVLIFAFYTFVMPTFFEQ